MNQPDIVPSLGTDLAAIGARAAGQLNIAFRTFMRGPGSVHRERSLTLVTGQPHPLGNVAIVDAADDLRVTEEAIAPLVETGHPSAVLFPRGVTQRVVEAVAGQGFDVDATMPAMAVDIAQMAGTALPAGYAWARIGDGSEGEAWTEALATGYEIPLPLAQMFGPGALGADMAPDAPVQFFAVLRDGRPVSTSMLYLADGLAGIYCVATLAEERGKGLGAHATAEALRAAEALGYRVGVLQSSPAGHAIYLRLGFGDYATVPMFVRMPG
jgi:GNAT superfamily N-acetyltransferase